MFCFIRRVYRYTLFFISLLHFIKNKDSSKIAKYLEKLEKNIYNCGPIGVKLIQFLIMYDGIMPKECAKKLNYTLENCKVHSWIETEHMYYTNYKRHIEDDFIIDSDNIDVIGSGSIGQVYKLYHRTLDKYVAVKVRHPFIDKEIL